MKLGSITVLGLFLFVIDGSDSDPISAMAASIPNSQRTDPEPVVPGGTWLTPTELSMDSRSVAAARPIVVSC